eukprot:snap_masked-scaffold_2-processed-gene-18.45-mRNA-1 protein AED:1.00 eAED:1.00 QI:0/-1/0/0/-1/1/1/0/343
MFHGERPDIVTPEDRRKIDVEVALESKLPSITAERKKLKAQGYAFEDDYFTSSRGLKLATRIILPPEKFQKKEVIIYCHGYTDDLRWIGSGHMQRLCRENFVVAGMELEGHGFSDGLLGSIPDLSKCIQDMEEFTLLLRKRWPEHKYFLLGGSLGGMVALQTALTAQKAQEYPDFDGVVLLSPMVKISKEVQPPELLTNFLMGIYDFVPNSVLNLSVTPSPMNDELVFKDPEAVKISLANPIKYIGRPRLGTAFQLLTSTIEIEREIENGDLKTPFLTLHGKKDVVTDYHASLDLYEKSTSVKAEDKKILLPDDGYHSLFFGEDPEVIEGYWKVVFDWLTSRQ